MHNSGYTVLKSGHIIGTRYQIIEKLGCGGFGCTYLAENIKDTNQSQCVVKQLQPIFSSPSIWENAIKRFHTEANVLKNLGFHPQIPYLLDYFEENQQFFLIQEFIDGEDLSKEIVKKTLSEIQVIALLQDVLEILTFVHQRGTIHRDIKPANLMRRSSDGKIVLIDFGAVKEVTTFFLDNVTGELGTVPIGTQGYWPPEQQNGKPKFNSDIYALGRTVIHCLTGELPLLLEDTITGELKSWQEKVSVSDKLALILNKMINPNFRERYQNAREILYELEPLVKIGKIMGRRYLITGYLGGKKDGHIYLASDQLDSDIRSCVIKQFKPPISDQASWEIFDHQFKILRRASAHEQIPEIYDHFQDNQEFFLVEQFIQGENLSTYITVGQKLNKSEVEDILKKVLKVLDFIHKQNIMHLNISPSNLIRRTKDNQIILIDFASLKKVFHHSLHSETNSSTRVLGTDGYMPPEQLARRACFASDIYALGITAIGALTGLKPENFPTDEQSGKFLWQQFPFVNHKLSRILDKMTALDLKNRYQSAEQVLNELEPTGKSGNRGWTFPMKPILVFLMVTVIPMAILLTQDRPARKLFQEGNQLFHEQKYEEAINKYNQVLSLNPRYHEALTNLGIAQGYLGQYYDMLGSCDLATTINKDSFLAWNCKGEALINLKQYSEAIVALDQAITINPDEPAFLINKTEALLKEKNFQAALTNINQAIELLDKIHITDPQHQENFQKDLAIAWNYKGWALRDLREFSRAIEAYNKALEFQSNYYPPQLGKAIVFWKDKQYKQAVEHFEKIINQDHVTDNQKLEVFYYKGLTLCEWGHISEGINSLDQALKINPKYQAAKEAKKACK